MNLGMRVKGSRTHLISSNAFDTIFGVEQVSNVLSNDSTSTLVFLSIHLERGQSVCSARAATRMNCETLRSSEQLSIISEEGLRPRNGKFVRSDLQCRN